MIESWAFALLVIGVLVLAVLRLARWIIATDEQRDARRRNRP